MANIDGFTFYRSYYNTIKDLARKRQDQFLRNVVFYIYAAQEPKGDAVDIALFNSARYQLDKSLTRSGSKEGKTKNKETSSENQIKNKETSSKNAVTGQDTVTVKDTVTDTASVKSILDLISDDDMQLIEKHVGPEDVIRVAEEIDSKKSSQDLKAIAHPRNYYKKVAEELGAWH